MSYLPLDCLHNLIMLNPTSLELDFIIYLAQYLDTDTQIKGVYYKDIKEALGCCKQSFYNVKDSLVKKNIIKVDRESDTDYDITFLFGTDFTYEHAKEVGYIPARLDVIHSKAFRELPVFCKMIALDILIQTRANNGWVIGVEKFYNKYGVENQELLPETLTVKTLKEYIKKLKDIFYINKTVKGNYTFALRAFEPDKNRKKDAMTSNKDLWSQRLTRTLCRRNKVFISSKKKLADAAHLLLQYKDIAENCSLSVCKVFVSAFEKMVDDTNFVLHPARLNTVFGKLLYELSGGKYVPLAMA